MNKDAKRPDRASNDSLDGLSDVPTYREGAAGGSADPAQGSSVSDRVRSVYQRAGRTAPQHIEPQRVETQRGDVQRGDSQATSAFEAQRGVAQGGATQGGATQGGGVDRDGNLYQVDEQTSTSYRGAEPEHTSILNRPHTSEQPAQAVYAEPAYTEPVQQFGPAPVAAAPVATAPSATEYVEEPQIEHRRGTMDFGLFLIRLITGAILTFQGLRTFFELGGAPGLNGLKDQFGHYASPDLLSIAVPSMQLAAGVFLLLGLLTPVAAAVATVVTAFNFLHAIAQQDHFSFTNPSDSVLFAGLLCALALGLQFTGPGHISLDVNRSWARRPLASSWILAILGIAGAVALWWFGASVNPFN